MKSFILENKRYMICAYDYVYHNPKVLLYNDFMGCFCNFLYRKKLQKLDSINCEQGSYCHFIQEAYREIKRYKDWGKVDKICFLQNPKEVIKKFDNNIPRLEYYTNIVTRSNAGKSVMFWFKGVSLLFIAIFMALALVSMLYSIDHRGLQPLDIKKYTSYLHRTSNINITAFRGEIRATSLSSSEELAPFPIDLHKISNVTHNVITSPYFDSTIALIAMFAFINVIMLIASAGFGFFNANSIIQSKVDEIPQLNEEAQAFFSNLDPESVTYEGVEYFAYDIQQRSPTC